MDLGRRERYRVFVQDVGRGGFSAFGDHDVVAGSPLEAIFTATRVSRNSTVGARWLHGGRPRWSGKRLIALPHSRRELWPEGLTGYVPAEAFKFWKG
jgi:hypothetical protein